MSVPAADGGWGGCRGARNTHLVHRLVVNANQVVGGRVDLQRLVECKGRLDRFRSWTWVSVGIPSSRGGLGRALGANPRTILAQDLALLDVLHEIGLLLVHAGGEALLKSGVDGKVDVLGLGLALRDGVLLLGAHLAALLSAQLAAEVGRAAPLLVKVHDIG